MLLNAYGYIAAGLFCLVPILLLFKKPTSVFVLVLAAGLAGALSRWDSLETVKVTADSLELKVREASNVLDGLRKLSIFTGDRLVELYSGTVPSYRDRVNAEVLGVFHDTGVGQAAIDDLNARIRQEDEIDYSNGIWMKAGSLDQALVKALVVETDKIKPLPNNRIYFTVDELQSAIDHAGIHDAKIDRILTDWHNFERTGVHSDLDLWNHRDRWARGQPD